MYGKSTNKNNLAYEKSLDWKLGGRNCGTQDITNMDKSSL